MTTTVPPAAGLTTRPAAGINSRSVAWMDDALCAKLGPDLWFAGTGNTVAAQQACDRCPVRAQCLAHVVALEAESPASRRFGVCGGVSARARKEAEEPGSCYAARDRRIIRLAAQDCDVAWIADDVGCDERTVYRVLQRSREAS